MEHIYSPKQFGKLIGKSVNTLQKWDRRGILHALRSPTNRRYYTHEHYLQYRGLISSEQGKVIAYARVSSPSQKKDLATQKEALGAYCLAHGVKVDEWVEDIGSALNYKRKGFNQIIEQIELGAVKRLVIGYQDRLVRFGYRNPRNRQLAGQALGRPGLMVYGVRPKVEGVEIKPYGVWEQPARTA